MVEFLLQNFFLGLGLAMDATAVSMTNGMNEAKMNLKKILFISLMFGLFQGLMPLCGYFAGHFFIKYIENIIPIIALIILVFLGLKMILDTILTKDDSSEKNISITFKVIFLQTIATSIDALSVGVTFSNYAVDEALISSSIIALVTFLICILGHYIGKIFGNKFNNKAQIIGGLILIVIGLEIFIKSFLK